MEASFSKDVVSSPAVDESAFKQVFQEQISSEQFVESVEEIPLESFLEPIEVLNTNTLVPNRIVAPHFQKGFLCGNVTLQHKFQ